MVWPKRPACGVLEMASFPISNTITDKFIYIVLYKIMIDNFLENFNFDY